MREGILLAMTHSDQFKPQSIAAVTKLRFDNCDDALRVFIGNQDTGSSRYYNILDFDGSVVGKNDGKAYILGSATTNWWRWSSACFRRTDWNVWACPKGSREVATLSFVVKYDGYIDSGPPDHVGAVALWGPGFTEAQGRNTSVAVTKWPGVTGVDGTGWYLRLDRGAPRFMSVYVAMLRDQRHVYLALPYPAGTTFSIYVRNQYWAGGGRNTTEVDSPQKVWNGDGYQWHFNGDHLFLKIDNLAASDSKTFARDGAYILEVDNHMAYDITATCQGTGFCALGADKWPAPAGPLWA